MVGGGGRFRCERPAQLLSRLAQAIYVCIYGTIIYTRQILVLCPYYYHTIYIYICALYYIIVNHIYTDRGIYGRVSLRRGNDDSRRRRRPTIKEYTFSVSRRSSHGNGHCALANIPTAYI